MAEPNPNRGISGIRTEQAHRQGCVLRNQRSLCGSRKCGEEKQNTHTDGTQEAPANCDEAGNPKPRTTRLADRKFCSADASYLNASGETMQDGSVTFFDGSFIWRARRRPFLPLAPAEEARSFIRSMNLESCLPDFWIAKASRTGNHAARVTGPCFRSDQSKRQVKLHSQAMS